MPIADPLSWLPVAFLVSGVLFVVLGTRQLVGTRARRESWRTVPGQVVTTRLEEGQYRCRVAYELDGRQLTFWNRSTASAVTDPYGREVEVWVNPDDPTDAVVGSGLAGSGSTVGVAFLAFGLAAAGAGLYLLS